ncbi:MAG TPA: hypothetical protein VM049_10095 [Gaiellaceae bacterium]|nr:hypothetical protein [Gaiellaceae bacterium]
MLPAYWMERPPLSLGTSAQAAIEEFLSVAQPRRGGDLLDADPIVHARGDVTPWQFLCGLAARCEIVFHGTGDPNIESFVPRQPIDVAPFGRQKAVFGTTDPIWAMFYAVVDRDRYRLTLNNACILLDEADGGGLPYYYFSITDTALPEKPWRTGYVYFLPAETFVAQPAATYAGHAARVPQLASPVAVRPFARIRVAPEDFPFLGQIRGHEDDRLAEYAQAIMAAAPSPWPD